MAAGKVPLEVGTRGTVGSLLKKEIEYFRRHDLERVNSSMNIYRSSNEMAAKECKRSWYTSLGSLFVPGRKKKRTSSGICSMVEVADSQGLDDIRSFSYRNLKAESSRF